MIENKIEQKIKNAIAPLLPDRVKVCGNWEVAAAGELKLMEETEARAFVVIAVPPRTLETFGFGAVSFNCSVAVAVRPELDPDGTLIMLIAARIVEVFTDWHLCRSEAMHNALSTEEFSADGFTLTGGTVPTFDVNRGVSGFSYTFTLKGIIK